VESQQIMNIRITEGTFASGGCFCRDESWQDNVQAHSVQPEPWTGTTKFQLKEPLADNPCFVSLGESAENQKCITAEICLTLDDFQKCLGKTYDHQENYLASAAKKQKVEVEIKDLSPADQKLFSKAKDKELESWLATTQSGKS